MTRRTRCTALRRAAAVAALAVLAACGADGDDSMRSIANGGVASGGGTGSTVPVVVTDASAGPAPQDTTVYPATGEVAEVLSIDNNFLPQVIEISAGTAVHWANNGRNDHDVTDRIRTTDLSAVSAEVLRLYGGLYDGSAAASPRKAMARAFGDIGLASAWQGDNSSIAPGLGTAIRATMNAGGTHWLQLPVAKNADGSPVTGPVLGRIINRSGKEAQPLIVQTNPVPYLPASLDTSQAKLVSRDSETMDGKVGGETPIAATD